MYLLALFVFSCLVKSSIPTDYALAEVESGNGEVLGIDIALDNTTMLTYPGKPDPPQACFEETINFHDFQKQLLAMKIVGKGQCIIKPSTETYERVKKLVDDIHQGKSEPIKQATEEWGVPNNALPTEEVESTVGKKIANFCTGYKVYVLNMGKDITHLRDLPRVSRKIKKRGSAWCWFCLWCAVNGR